MKNTLFLLIWSLLGYASCYAQDLDTNTSYLFVNGTNELPTPPNCIYLSDSLMCDKTEISNIDWKEYLYHTQLIFGENSPEYLAAYPDISGNLINVDTLSSSTPGLVKMAYYLSTDYDYYPLVGVSLEQAKKFSKWRSDRVFEMILIENGIIDLRSDRTKNDQFTINGFLNSNMAKNLKGKITHYPMYFVPTINEWNIVKKMIEDKSISVGVINSRNKAMIYQRQDLVPLTAPSLDKTPDDNILYNILGNVSEMIDDKNTSFGGSYEDSLDSILEMNTTETELPNATTGFRNFCIWIEI